MSKSKERRQYSREFKLKAVRMEENRKPGETQADVAEALGISVGLLVKWKKKYSETAEDAFLKKDPLLLELERLHKENKSLQEDRDILKKALSIFGRQEKN